MTMIHSVSTWVDPRPAMSIIRRSLVQPLFEPRLMIDMLFPLVNAGAAQFSSSLVQCSRPALVQSSPSLKRWGLDETRRDGAGWPREGASHG